MFDILVTHRELQRAYGEAAPNAYPFEPGEKLVKSEELLACLRFNKEAEDVEYTEVLAELPWKAWKTEHRAQLLLKISNETRIRVKEELVDKGHFFFNMLLAAGFSSWAEFEVWYVDKNTENLRRIQTGY